MSPRKHLQNTDPPGLPTIKDYFGMMAEGQRDDILRLKHEAMAGNTVVPGKQASATAIPDPWLMHPIRSPRHSSAELAGAARSTSKYAAKKAPKKAVKKASKKSRR